MSPSHPQDSVQTRSLRDPEGFWAQEAERLDWHTKPSSILTRTTKTVSHGNKNHDNDNRNNESTDLQAPTPTTGKGQELVHPHWEWFQGGELSTCYNCVDRHVRSGNGDQPAIYYDSPVTGKKQTITYAQLLDEVEVTAGALREEGIKKGDVVMIYMPMIPQALIGMLAAIRLGAVHACVFGGFASQSLAQRIDASRPVALLTASCGVEGSKGAIPYGPLVRSAVEAAVHKPSKVFVWQRNDQVRWDRRIDPTVGEIDWYKKVRSCRARGVRVEDCVPVRADEPLYIIYTSGTTGQPKGVVRDVGGHAVGLQLSIRYLFGIKGPGDVMFCASDIGWVVGHSFIFYAPLLAGAATVLFEGKPVGTPDSSTFWRIVRDYKVNALFTAPTALRAIKRDDPGNKHLKQIGAAGGLKSLRALFLAGERSEPSIITMYQELLAQHGAPGATVIDNWWSSESGSPISGIALNPETAASSRDRTVVKPLPIKPGSAGKAMPGFDVRAVDDEGNEVGRGKMGNIVMSIPLAPTGFRTLWGDDARFYKSYLQRFGGRWIDTGDAGMIDSEGYISIMSRSDDLINTAGHRLSTGAIEQAITSHPSVAEASVVGIPDSLKGQLPFAFVTLSTADHPTSAIPSPDLVNEIQNSVRQQIGGIASLGGVIQGKGMIPKTRSGKTLRRVLRELVENAVTEDGQGANSKVSVPATIEDPTVIDVARAKVVEYFKGRGPAAKL